ncbi:MAG: glycosyltransferase family 4 protein [Hydrococcus sp. Prado102]|jgi:glycosyltransferase involved in cell wall biosynthesis|nr:glycosyltransferase family 4 protein [Hydrococcus sp. Prado102]
MKVLHLSTSDLDGGAARAAYRLHQGLQAVNVESQMLVRAKCSSDKSVIAETAPLTKLGPVMSEIPLKLYPKRNPGLFSLQWFPDRVNSKVAQLDPDILNLHWVGTGFLQIETLSKFKQPLVWTLHDMWSFTGGCHYTQECDRYMDSCGSCPQLKSNKNWDFSRWTWQRKVKMWKGLNLILVAPSFWMAKCVKASSIFRDFRVEVIPYGLDTVKYKPIQRQIARKLLNLPQNKQLILFSAMTPSDPRKGFYLLQQTLQKLTQSGWQDRVELMILGESTANSQLDSCFKTHYMGRLGDDLSLALVYSAADIFAAPSTQDNLPNTVMEALACGTPCVAFKIGGMPDMVEHQQNGYLAAPYEIEDFANGIAWILETKQRHQKLCDRAREKVEQEYTLDRQGQRYLSLYDEILGKSK